MAGDDKNWWERNVEDEMAADQDRQRALLGDNPVEVAKHDVIVGVGKGTYHFGKGMVVGVVDLALVAAKVVTFDGPTWGKIWDATKWVATEGYTSQFGSDAEKKAQNDRAEATLRTMAGQLRDKLSSEWDEASRAGKRTELVSKWGTEGILTIASFFIGAGELKAAASAAKAGDALGAAEVLANVTAKCPKLAAAEEAAQAAKLAKAADEAAALAKAAEEAAALQKANAAEEVTGKFNVKEIQDAARRAEEGGASVAKGAEVFQFGPNTLTADEVQALQKLADKYDTTIDVIGSRATGKGRNIDNPLLETGKGPNGRSDIDMRIDGDVDISSGGRFSNDISNMSNGAGSVASSTGLPSTPPYIQFRPHQPPIYVKE